MRVLLIFTVKKITKRHSKTHAACISPGQMFWTFPSNGLSLSLHLLVYYYRSHLQFFLVLTFPQHSPEEKPYIIAIMALVIR